MPRIMEDEADSSSSGVKRVRWDESVVDRAGKNEIVEINNAAGLDQKADTPEVLPVAPSCSANKVIRLMSGAGAEQLEAGNEYKPEFTHQVFDGERIMGYAEGEVTIRIRYTRTSLHFLVEINTCDNNTAREAEILTRLSRALPIQACCTDKSDLVRLLEGKRTDFKPPGSRSHHYTRGEKTFAVYRATGEDPGACEYHERAQSLAPWFIETADQIDLSDDRWEVFYLFEEETPREVLGEKWRPVALAGYFTVFGFRNPVKGISWRICQALVLPQYQRQGHGQALLAFLYDMARERESVFEITVEDPAPGFEKLRNLVDARFLRDHKAFPDELLSPQVFQRPTKETVQATHKALKLTVSQIEIAFDILKARDVQGLAISAVTTTTINSSAVSSKSGDNPHPESIPNTAGVESVQGGGTGQVEETRRRYRLMVKRRLLKRYGEELAVDAPTRKRQLEEFYREVEGAFLDIGAKLVREEGRRGSAKDMFGNGG